MDYLRFKVEHGQPAVESGTQATIDNQDEINNGNQDGETGDIETEAATDGNENLATTSHITPEILPAAHYNVSVLETLAKQRLMKHKTVVKSPVDSRWKNPKCHGLAVT